MGNPEVDSPNVFVSFAPGPIAEADSAGDHTATIDGRSTRPRRVSLSVSADANDKANCRLATDLATALARRLPD